MELEIDNLTVGLLAALAALLIYLRFFTAHTPLVHPLLLGKQSDVSSVRRKGETGVYRSFATGQGSPFSVRPANNLKTVQDLVQLPKNIVSAVPRLIHQVELTDEALTEVLRLLPLGLHALFPSLRFGKNSKTSRSILTLLPPSSQSALPLLFLQMATLPHNPLVILPSPEHIKTALDNSSHPTPAVIVARKALAEDLIEELVDQGVQIGLLIVDDPERSLQSLATKAAKKRVHVRWWEEIWEEAQHLEKDPHVANPNYSDVHSYFYSDVEGTDSPAVVKVTHMNITAGIAGVLSAFPVDKRPSGKNKDRVVSAISLNTPLGMTIALASIWTGAGYQYVGGGEDSEAFDTQGDGRLSDLEDSLQSAEPKTSVLFLTKGLHRKVVEGLVSAARTSPPMFFATALSHKLAGLLQGHISRQGLWENLVWKPFRRQSKLDWLTGASLRAVVVVGDAPEVDVLTAGALLTSLPTSRIFGSQYSAGPVFNTHFQDIQTRGISESILSPSTGGGQLGQSSKSHTGPPSSNVEVKLRGDTIEEGYGNALGGGQGSKLSGRIYARGPAILQPLDTETTEGWVDLHVEAAVQTNGTFITA